MKNTCTKENMECKKPIVNLRQKASVRREKLQKGREENEVENEKGGWKKNKGSRYPEDPLCHILQ